MALGGGVTLPTPPPPSFATPDRRSSWRRWDDRGFDKYLYAAFSTTNREKITTAEFRSIGSMTKEEALAAIQKGEDLIPLSKHVVTAAIIHDTTATRLDEIAEQWKDKTTHWSTGPLGSIPFHMVVYGPSGAFTDARDIAHRSEFKDPEMASLNNKLNICVANAPDISVTEMAAGAIRVVKRVIKEIVTLKYEKGFSVLNFSLVTVHADHAEHSLPDCGKKFGEYVKLVAPKWITLHPECYVHVEALPKHPITRKIDVDKLTYTQIINAMLLDEATGRGFGNIPGTDTPMPGQGSVPKPTPESSGPKHPNIPE